MRPCTEMRDASGNARSPGIFYASIAMPIWDQNVSIHGKKGMSVGYFRFILALIVCSNHLSSFGGAGRYAVFSFYILSGFLMTTILNEKYGLSPSGIGRYALNRLLRIYPIYLLALSLAIASLFYFNNESSVSIEPTFTLPTDSLSWVKNILLIGMNFMHMERVIPPAWTLYVEVSFYMIIPLVMLLGRKAIWIWFIGSVAYHIFLLTSGSYPNFDWNQRYGTVMAGSLGFSLGCLASTYKNRIIISPVAGLLSLTAIAFIHIFAAWGFGEQVSSIRQFFTSVIFNYLNLVCSSIAVLFLFSRKESSLSRKTGDFSYPLYLVHIPCCYIVFMASGYQARSTYLFLSSMALSLIVSYLLILVERRVNVIRRRVKT